MPGHARAVLIAVLLMPLACITPQPLRADVSAASPESSPEQAAALFDAKDWKGAAKAYQAILDRDPASGEMWFRLGLSLRQTETWNEAAAAYEQAEKRGYTSTQLLGSAAICWTQLGNPDRALEYLGRAAGQGISLTFLNSNPGLAKVRDDPRFKALVDASERKSHPCEREPRYRAFDFWIGDWEVFSNGQKVGDNRIESILRGCVLFENWIDVAGSSGKSFNYLDPGSGKWKQNWVAENGNLVFYEGEVKGGAMHYLGELIKPDGSRQTDRVTLTPGADGTVRHLIETTADGGKTWTPSFDGTYVRRKTVEASK